MVELFICPRFGCKAAITTYGIDMAVLDTADEYIGVCFGISTSTTSIMFNTSERFSISSDWHVKEQHKTPQEPPCPFRQQIRHLTLIPRGVIKNS